MAMVPNGPSAAVNRKGRMNHRALTIDLIGVAQEAFVAGGRTGVGARFPAVRLDMQDLPSPLSDLLSGPVVGKKPLGHSDAAFGRFPKK